MYYTCTLAPTYTQTVGHAARRQGQRTFRQNAGESSGFVGVSIVGLAGCTCQRAARGPDSLSPFE